jgi:hypothetical protein
MGQPHS